MLPAMNPMLLQHTLRGLCTDSQWVYAVFWRILPRNYPPPQWDTEGGIMDRSKGNKRNWILVWEDGFCDFSACASGTGAASSSFLSSTRQLWSNSDDEPVAMNPELFFKMSHEVYNFGEGLMGKVAVDNSHKWVYKEPLENEISFLSPWHTSLDPHPRTWEAQFKSGIETIAVVAVQEGVLQLGSTKRVIEDLSFVLYMQRKFNVLHSIPGVFVPHSSSGSGTKRSSPGMASPSLPFDASSYGHSAQLTQRSIDQFLSPRAAAADPWRPMISNVPVLAGTKRPPEASSSSQSLNLNEYAYLTGGYPESSPSPPKALNTGHTSPQGATSPTLLPSMSSLQALLSKLPSVKAHSALEAGKSNLITTSAYTLPTSSEGAPTFTSADRPPIARSASNSAAKASSKEQVTKPKRIMVTKGESMDSGGSTSDVGDVDTVDDHPPPSCATTIANYAHHESTTFLESLENLNEYGIPEVNLENGDSSYTSFLNEIYS